MLKILLKVVFITILSTYVFSAEQNIDMLNKLGKGINVYSKKLLM